MIAAENKALVRRFIERVENTGDVSRIHDYIAENYVEVHNGEIFPIGIEGAKEHVLGVRRVFPDLRITIENQIAEGEWVATTYSVTGTFQEEWFGMKPTGRSITFTGVNMDRVREGKIVEHGGAANLLDPLLNAGVILKK